VSPGVAGFTGAFYYDQGNYINLDVLAEFPTIEGYEGYPEMLFTRKIIFSFTPSFF
jgi:hypothetical protein